MVIQHWGFSWEALAVVSDDPVNGGGSVLHDLRAVSNEIMRA